MKQAIYREFRPKDFNRVIGQKHIVEILKNQIKTNTLGHSYLFSGIRGTGKTSCAKIFARAVNCLNPKDGNPCNECENCKMILDDKALEVVEMDAASNRRIDDIRELKEKVIYPPQNVKYKVYIIDEAHMITNEGFNALLKIMEEPPKHLIFILATTELEKLPDTIISRCQRFEFKRISNEDIKENIKYILRELNVSCEERGIDLICELSSGAMRDALSLLDQVISIGKNHITVEDINNCLGLVNLDNLFEISNSIVENSALNTLKSFKILVESGKNIVNIFTDLIKHFRNILLTKNLDKSLTNLNDVEYKRYLEHSKFFNTSDLILIIENLIDSTEKLKRSDLQNSIAEVSLIKICNTKIEKTELEKRVESLEKILKSGNFNISNNSNVENLSSAEKINSISFDNSVENVIKTENVEIENSKNYEDTIDIPFIDDYEIMENSITENKVEKTEIDIEKVVESNNIESVEIDLMSFKDVIKNTIFKKAPNRLFEESIKGLIYHSKENFLQVDCREYLFKVSSYKLDEKHSFEVVEREILNEFFSKINLENREKLIVFANFVSEN